MRGEGNIAPDAKNKGRRGKELDVMHELTLHGPEEQLDVAVALCFDVVGSLALSRHAESSQTQRELPPYMPSIPPEGVHDEAHSPAQECANADQKVAETLHDEAHHPAQECTHEDLPQKSRECCGAKIPWWDDWAFEVAEWTDLDKLPRR